MALFESTSSVFEIMWDIALFFFIVRLAFYYFALTFSFDVLLAAIRLVYLMPVYQLTQPEAELILMPLLLLFIILCGQFLISRYEIPRCGGFRLAIGSLAAVFMMFGDLIAGIVMYKEGWREWYRERYPVVFSIFCITMVFFALMPYILMLREDADEINERPRSEKQKPST
jgi:hypothetical protein